MGWGGVDGIVLLKSRSVGCAGLEFGAVMAEVCGLAGYLESGKGGYGERVVTYDAGANGGAGDPLWEEAEAAVVEAAYKAGLCRVPDTTEDWVGGPLDLRQVVTR